MGRLNIILVLSAIIFLLPFLGFPQAFDNFLYVVLGIVIFVLALLLKGEVNQPSQSYSEASKKYVRNEPDGNTGGEASRDSQE